MSEFGFLSALTRRKEGDKRRMGMETNEGVRMGKHARIQDVGRFSYEGMQH